MSSPSHDLKLKKKRKKKKCGTCVLDGWAATVEIWEGFADDWKTELGDSKAIDYYKLSDEPFTAEGSHFQFPQNLSGNFCARRVF
jgi:hypothetical protein